MAEQIAGSAPKLDLMELVRPIQDDLLKVEGVLRKELQSDIDAVSEMLDHPMFWSGKRIRPILLLLAGRACGALTPQHHLLAAVLEMIHVATLVHDDVLDSAEMRRHCKSINQTWGNQLSVLLGDFLFSHAFYLASTCESTYACQTIGKATNAVCAGEMQQIVSQGNLGLDEESYLRIIDGKTASLCACACLLGGYSSGADADALKTLEAIGLNYGRAFQIVDDVLDLMGTEDRVGKSLGSDVRQLKMTLPLIHALEQCDETRRKEWLTRLESGDYPFPELIELIKGNDGFDYALDFATNQVYSAKQWIREVISSDEFGKELLLVGDFILTRKM